MVKLFIQKVSDVEDVGYQKDGDAAIDLRASGTFIINLDEAKKEISGESYEIKPNERILVKTGIKVQIPKGHWGNIRDRSGLAFKHGIHHLAGVIDETYRGEIGVVVVNMGKKPYKITKNERIGQMIIAPYANVDIEYVKELDESNRGSSGYGDSGKH